MPNFFEDQHKLQHTVPIRPNLTESTPQLNPGITFRVYSGFTRGLLEQTQSKPKVYPQSKPRLEIDP